MISTPLPFDPTGKNLLQFSTLHKAIVKDVKDPERRGRVKCECPGLLGTGRKNWTPWCEVFLSPLGSVHGGGDQGNWQPLQPGQIVGVGFISGDPFAYFCVAGPPCQTEPGENKQLLPLEQKAVCKKNARAAARIDIKKSEAGHTLIMDDRGKSELMALLDWTGAGTVIMSPGKVADEEEKEGEESKPRKGKRRGTKNVFAGTSGKPSELIDGNVQIIARGDLNGQGMYTIATDGAGVVTVFASKGGGSPDAYAWFDAKTPKTIVGAGATQIQIEGDTGNIRVTRQIIQEAEPIDLSPWFAAVQAALKKRMQEYDE